MIILKIAFRNLFRQKRRSLYTAISIIIGSTLLSISIALAEGGYGNIIEMFTRGFTGHVQIHSEDYLEKPGLYKNFDYTDEIANVIQNGKLVQSHAPRIYSGALAFIDKKTTGTRIIGIDPTMEKQTTTIASKLGEGQFISDTSTDNPHNEIVIGRGMADILKAQINSKVVLISQSADGSIANDIFKVVGIMAKGSDNTERMNCYMHLYKAQEFLVLPERVHEIAIVLDSHKNAYQAVGELQTLLSAPQYQKLSIAPWQKVEEMFFNSMQADKAGNNVMIVIIVLIVGLGVLNTVLMSILERTREFGIMKALGTTPGKIALMIIVETFMLAGLGATIALFTGALANWPLVEYGIKYSRPLSVGGIYFEGIHSGWILEAFATPFIVVITTAVVVSTIPAIKAARIKPVDAIRTY